jgi:hypothetical protein
VGIFGGYDKPIALLKMTHAIAVSHSSQGGELQFSRYLRNLDFTTSKNLIKRQFTLVLNIK